VAFCQYFAAGIIASGIMSATFVNVGASVAADRADGTLTRLAGTPMPPAAYFAGKAIGALAVAAAEAGLLLAVGQPRSGCGCPQPPAAGSPSPGYSSWARRPAPCSAWP
jgi:ABC-2 type transport system permease protein